MIMPFCALSKAKGMVIKMKKLIIFLLLILVMNPQGVANATSTTSPANNASVEKNKKMNIYQIKLEQWLDDTGQVATGLTHWDHSDWGKALLYGGLTYIIHDNDIHIQHHFQATRNNTTNNIAKIGNAVPMAGVIYFTDTYLFGNERQRKTASNGLESMGIASLITQALKYASHRERPNGADNLSFPSGHTAAAFAMSTVIAEEYKDYKAVPYLAYGLSTLTAYARMNDNKHWASDVFVGGLIGHYTAKTIIKLNASREYKIQPFIGLNNTGVLISKQI